MPFRPTFSFFDNFSSRRKAARRQEVKERYDADLRKWQKKCERVTTANEGLKREYETTLARAKANHQSALDEWRDARDDFLAKQRAENRAVDEHKAHWQSGDTNAVETYCDIVLSASSYDECCPQEFELEYNRENRMLVVDYQLPAPEALPTLSEVKYIISRQEFAEKNLPLGRQRQMYDSLLYQITLRTLHELFEADSIGALDAVVFNGVVTSIDRGTGQKATACVLSIQASREELEMDEYNGLLFVRGGRHLPLGRGQVVDMWLRIPEVFELPDDISWTCVPPELEDEELIYLELLPHNDHRDEVEHFHLVLADGLDPSNPSFRDCGISPTSCLCWKRICEEGSESGGC